MEDNLIDLLIKLLNLLNNDKILGILALYLGLKSGKGIKTLLKSGRKRWYLTLW